MEYRNESGELNKLAMTIIGGAVFLGLTLIMGSYGYIWSEMRLEQEEKREWRQEHQRVLDKRFDELKQGQDKLEETVNKSANDTKQILQQILDEQKRVSEDIRHSGGARSSRPNR